MKFTAKDIKEKNSVIIHSMMPRGQVLRLRHHPGLRYLSSLFQTVEPHIPQDVYPPILPVVVQHELPKNWSVDDFCQAYDRGTDLAHERMAELASLLDADRVHIHTSLPAVQPTPNGCEWLFDVIVFGYKD
jgi:hypothetical protein